MKFTRLVLFFVAILMVNLLSGQTILEGIVKDKNSDEPLPFATVLYAPGEGVITNEQGYFRLPLTPEIKQLNITYIGYQDIVFPLPKGQAFVQVLMAQKIIPLQAVTVYASQSQSHDLFFKSITKSRKEAGYRHSAKAFRRTYSYRDQLPSEHMEAFYSAKTRGGGVDFLDLKNGRYGVPSDTSFINLQMTNLLEAYRPFINEEAELPSSPLEYTALKKLEQDYEVFISNIFAVEADTIIEFSFTPLKKQRAKFSGKAWVRNSNLIIEKVELSAINTTRNPFSIIPDPELNKVAALNLNLVFGFKYHEDKAVLDYLHFDQEMDVSTPVDTFHVVSNTNLYFYDYSSSFTVPFFPEFVNRYHDYEQILFFPYDKDFWEANYLIAETAEEKAFREELEARQLFKNQSGNQSILIQRRFETWRPDWEIEPLLIANRQIWEKRKLYGTAYVNRLGVPEEHLLFAKTFIFLDYDCLPNDTIQFRTEAIFDYRLSFSDERTIEDFELLEDFLRITKLHAHQLQAELEEEFGTKGKCPDRKMLKMRLNQAERKLKKALKKHSDDLHSLSQEKRIALSEQIKEELRLALEKNG